MLNKILILTHWDTDGIVSAALLAKNLNCKTEFLIPEISHYFLTDKEIKKIKKAKFSEIYLTDMALDQKSREKLKPAAKKITILDHHYTGKTRSITCINPILEGKSALKYPCACQVVAEFVGEKEELLPVIGAIGDKEEEILKNKYFAKKIKNVEKKNKLSFNKLNKIKLLLDSNYMVNNKKGVIAAIKITQKNVQDILKNKKMIQQRKKIDNELKKLLKSQPALRKGKIVYFNISSNYKILSSITRELAKKYPDNLVVVRQKSNIYIRRKNLPVSLKPAIEFANRKGHIAGGKDEVCGIILKKPDKKFLQQLFEVLT